MTACAKADALATFAASAGWEVTCKEGADYVDVTASHYWNAPDGESDGWVYGVMLRYYRTPAGGWRLGALDDAGRQVVGGVASRPNGPEFEFWLGSIRLLRRYLEAPALLVEWLEANAPR